MSRRRGRKLMGEINVVPYIDVMLVLLIIFMVTAPMLSQGIKVDLPQAAAEPIEPDDLEPLLLSVDARARCTSTSAIPSRPLDADTAARSGQRRAAPGTRAPRTGQG